MGWFRAASWPPRSPLGGDVRVRAGSDVGGDSTHVRACRAAAQVGCVVAYSTFGRTPPRDAVFGRAHNSLSPIIRARAGDGLQVLCTNPAAPRGGAAPLTTMAGGGSTPWATYPGLYAGRCRSERGATWLDVDVSPTDPRAPLRFPASANPARGLHLFDVNIAMGDLLELVRRQARGWLAREAAYPARSCGAAHARRARG